MSKASIILVEALGGLLLALVVYLTVHQVWSWKKAAEANGATVKEQAATAQTAGAIAQDLGAKTSEAQRVEVVVTQKRGEYDAQYQELKASDAGVADWADGRIPQRLRDLARSRRAARDGLGAPEAGSPPADRAEDGARGDPAPGPS